MEGEEEGGGIRLSKRFDDNNGSKATGEVDYKTKSGTAWSHNFLNQKPWHPLSYPNQRRKWIAEQTNANHQRRADEVAREFAQEQEFFRQTALVSKKEKEKIEIMKAVSFMYVRPPGYDPESAKAAEMAEERKNQGDSSQDQPSEGTSNAIHSDPKDNHVEVKKKSRPKDVFGRSLPTGEEFEILKNAPKMETGIAGRPKPFAVEIRNVKCLRCGTFGHQSGDRECILKDTITPNEESRLKRDDPLTAIMAHTEAAEPLKWELKQRPGISPPRGGFDIDDPNQQIVAEDIFDEYGGFLNDEFIPELLALPKKKKSPRKSKSKKRSPKADGSSSSDDDGKRKAKRREKKYKIKKQKRPPSDDNNSEPDQPHSKNKQKRSSSKYHDSGGDDSEAGQPHGKNKLKHSSSKYFDSDCDEPKDDRSHRNGKNKHPNSSTVESPNSSKYHRKNKHKHSSSNYSDSYEDDSETDKSHRKSKRKHSHAPASKYDSEDRYRSRHHHRKNPEAQNRYRSGYYHEDNNHDQKNPDAEDHYKRRHHHQDNDHDQKNPDADNHYRSRHHHQDNDHDQKKIYAEGRYSSRHHRDSGNN